MYNASTLAELMDIIVKRGMSIDTEQGFVFKLHEEHPDAPRSPITFNLATPKMRDGGRLNEDDMLLMGRLLWEYTKRNHIPVPAIAGVPNVGEGLARALQYGLRNETGQYVPLIAMEKKPGSQEIAEVAPNPEHAPNQAVMLMDDVLVWGHSAQEAASRLRQVRYIVRQALVVLDYELGGRDALADIGVEARGILSVPEIIEYGLETRTIPVHHGEAVRGFLANMRTYAATHHTGAHALVTP